MDLSVLIVAYRNPELTRACLASVFEQTHGSFEVIVVDNASGDGTPDMIEREFPQARLIRSDRNLGFAGANNLAAREARGDWLLLLNPDTVVLDRALERLLAFGRGQDVAGLFGGRTLRPDGTLEPSSCWGPQTPWSTFCFASGLSTAFRRNPVLDPESLGSWQRDTVRDVGIVTGCLLLTTREAWQRLGGFDERFFMYGEDADLAVRARSLGLPVRITPDAEIVHVVGASSDSSAAKVSMLMRARVTIMRKHWNAPARAFGMACLLAGVLVRGLRKPAWREVWRGRRQWLQGYPAA